MKSNSQIATILKKSFDASAIDAALHAANDTKVSIIEILIEQGYPHKMLLSQLANHAGLELKDLSTLTFSTAHQSLLDEATARQHKIIPLQRENNTLTIAVGNPLNLALVDTLHYQLNCHIQRVVALPSQIEMALETIYTPPSEKRPLAYKIAIPDYALKEATDPIIQYVNQLIQDAIDKLASDIHLEPLLNTFRIRYRIDGVLYAFPSPPHEHALAIISRIKILARMKISEKRMPQDGRAKMEFMGQTLDLRISTVPSHHGESMVIRILNRHTLSKNISDLGFMHNQSIFQERLQHPSGMMLATGPTGSGKTTTLYTCLHILNQPNQKVITIEDPVEYQLKGINQVQVHPQIGLTFPKTLHSILRQAPNVIMIGEIRDLETAQTAIHAALSGHFILSTLHTNHASDAITRLIHMGIKPFLLASALDSILAQRLVRTLCPSCKTENDPSPAEQELLQSNRPLFYAQGCPQCQHTGYLGRKALFEHLSLSDSLRNMIQPDITAEQLRSKAREHGMRTLWEEGLEQIKNGTISLHELLRIIPHP